MLQPCLGGSCCTGHLHGTRVFDEQQRIDPRFWPSGLETPINKCIDVYIILEAISADPMKISRADDAYIKLKAEILENRLPPGFQATEPEIALRLGMSRTPVREALLRLEADGLVQMKPRRGARVLPLSLDDMKEIYEILTALEPEAAAALAKRRPDRQALKPLLNATNDMERALADNDLDAWAAADDRFHRELLVLHDNKRLTGFVTSMYDQAHRARMITLRLRQLPRQSTQDHRDILQFIETGEIEQARETFRRHRESAAGELLSLLETHRLTSV